MNLPPVKIMKIKTGFLMKVEAKTFKLFNRPNWLLSNLKQTPQTIPSNSTLQYTVNPLYLFSLSYFKSENNFLIMVLKCYGKAFLIV